jgi:hypothetical protein
MGTVPEHQEFDASVHGRQPARSPGLAIEVEGANAPWEVARFGGWPGPPVQNELPMAGALLQLGAVDPKTVNSKPQLLAWLLCDGVHIDPGTGKHTILGVFSNIKALRFPVVHPHMVWFMTLTDVSAGAHRMRISMGLDPTAPKPLIDRPFESQGPLARINLINDIRNLSFPQPGDYSILIEIDDEPILATSIAVGT